MTFLKLITGVIAMSFIPIEVLSASQCKMIEKYTHDGKNGSTKIFSANIGISSLFYTADMDVNTDGAARSYHPDDPRGKSLAYNNMGSAITRAWNSKGNKIVCDMGDARKRKGACFQEFMDAYNGAKANKFNSNKYPKIETKYIIPWKKSAPLNWETPCTIRAGRNKGFFVSQTSLRINRLGDKCDQSIYVDSLEINAVVRTGGAKWKSGGVVTDDGDLVVVRNRKTGKIAYALHGDVGPKRSIGEGSIALVSELSGKTLPENPVYKDVKKLAIGKVDYLIFPRHDVERFYRLKGGVNQNKIDKYGKIIFTQWGGEKRLNACAN